MTCPKFTGSVIGLENLEFLTLSLVFSLGYGSQYYKPNDIESVHSKSNLATTQICFTDPQNHDTPRPGSPPLGGWLAVALNGNGHT